MLYIWILSLSAVCAAALLYGLNFWWKKDLLRGFIHVTLAFFLLAVTVGIGVVQSVGVVFDEKVKQHNLERFFYDDGEPKG